MNPDPVNQGITNNQQQSQLPQAQSQQTQSQTSAPGMEYVSTLTRFFDAYDAPSNSYDEIMDADGNLRPQWKKIEETLGQIDAETFNRRLTQIRRFVHQNGIVFSSYGDPNDRKNHLQLDPIPQLIDAPTWSTIEEGLQQRATIYNLLLKDIFGPKKLLSSGVIPPRVI
ncbi:circularly permuted type 2 ATP-grasp protein, partial [bacterium]|nr:circularly permuted type 2 ATP-grasp protein [bacterium]